MNILRSTASTNSCCWKLRSEPKRALCRPHVGPMLAYLGRWRQPRHPLRTHLCAGSFSTRRQRQTSLQTLPHTSLMHPPPRSAHLPSHPYQPHRVGHAGPSLPYVGHRLDPSWRILGRCWAHVDVFWIYVGPMLGVAGPKVGHTGAM